MALRKVILYKNEHGDDVSILDTNNIGYVKLKKRIGKGYDTSSVVQTYEDQIPENPRQKNNAAKMQKNEFVNSSKVTYNGNTFQTRPSDEMNFRKMIDKYPDTKSLKWILADNTIVTVTIADLKVVLQMAVDAAEQAFNDYIAVLEAL